MAFILTPTGPVNQDDWPVPRGPVYPVTLRTWLQSTTAIPFFDATKMPARVMDFGYQLPVNRPGQFWTSSTIARPYQVRTWPFNWPPHEPTLPKRKTPAVNLVGFTWRNPNLRPLPAPGIFSQDDWPVPQRPPVRAHFISIAFRNPNLKPLPAPGIFSQDDWPVLQRRYPNAHLTSFASNELLPQPSPFSQDDWPVPTRAEAQGLTWTNPAITAAATVDYIPSRVTEWGLPPPSVFIQSRQAPNNLALAIGPTPFVQTDWPVPQRPPYPTALLTWTNTFLPYTYMWREPSYFRYFTPRTPQWDVPPNIALTSAPVVTYTPGFVTEWGNQVAKARVPTWDNINLTILLPPPVQLPKNQSDWPLPIPPRYPIALRTWTSSTIELKNQVRTGPFNQADWPVPQRPKYPEGTYIYSTIGLRNQVRTGPFNISDWPVPQRQRWPQAQNYGTSAIRIPIPVFPPGKQMLDLAQRRPWQPQPQAASLSALYIPPFVPPIPPTPTPQRARAYIRDYWDIDAWGRFVPGNCIREG